MHSLLLEAPVLGCHLILQTGSSQNGTVSLRMVLGYCNYTTGVHINSRQF